MRSYVLNSRHCVLLATTALVAVTVAAPGAAWAQDATWNLNGTGNYNTPGNWTPATVPSGTASFGVSNQAAVNILASNAIGGWTFNAAASAYTFNIALNFVFNGAGIIINGGSATLTNPLGVVQFLNSSTAGAATINNSSILTFFNTSTAGSAVITNSVSGALGFNNISTAGNATITNLGTMNFNDISKGGNAAITNNKNLDFNNNSTAGNATITNSPTGSLEFNNSSTAGSASITNNNTLNFRDTSSAGSATITNNSNILFFNTSSAGSASITNNASGAVVFLADSTAGNASITNNGALTFDGRSTASSASITNNNNMNFIVNSTGGNAAITNNAGGVVDFSTSTGPLGDRKLSAGSIAGAGSFVLGANELTVGGNNMSTEVSGVVSGLLGSLVKAGTGTLTLSGTNAYLGSTTVNAGALAVNGSIASSSLTTVNSGAALLGTGTVGSTAIKTGGFLIPGPVGTPGALTVAGNLAFQSGAFYVVQFNPATASTTNVSGTASLAGTVAGVFGPGTYLTRSYTILSATGGRSGTFDALGVSGLPASFQVSLSYPGNTAVLNLTAQLVPEPPNPNPPNPTPIPPTPISPTPIPPTPTTPPIVSTPTPPQTFTINQFNVGHAIDSFFNNGGALPPAFVSLFGLTGSNLTNALSQLSGEPATGAQKAAFQLTHQFLNVMLDPFVDGRGGAGGADQPALGFGPERETLPPDIARAYASVFKAPPAAVPVYEPRWSAWGGAYGGSNRTNGDPAMIGSHDLSGRTVGVAAGLDYQLTPNTVAGFAVAGGGADWSLSQGLGGGKTDALQAGVYGATRSGPAYFAAAFAFANHWMSTDRGAVGDHLTTRFNAQSYGGRLEGGYRFGMPFGGMTPYAAIQAQSFHMPGFSETGTIANGFALAFASRDANDARSELGARLDRILALYPDTALTLHGRLAWAHDWATNPWLAPTFQALPGAGFVVYGATPAKNSALASAGAELRLSKGLSLLAKFDGEFASGSRTYAGTGTLRYTW